MFILLAFVMRKLLHQLVLLIAVVQMVILVLWIVSFAYDLIPICSTYHTIRTTCVHMIIIIPSILEIVCLVLCYHLIVYKKHTNLQLK
ncbi:hypothetical protein PMAYCL1PPCAC_27490 [Pristionchus mayeri]|uniref:Uncharacterized protein n=1 Tax=Pristionchus mayeri TaxID=1317129 RepID=A0AAN5D7X8_9BILA|nr:hypothetical protein PMAYCL1PPCAC_27490 [Pristionchus mayeri]